MYHVLQHTHHLHSDPTLRPYSWYSSHRKDTAICGNPWTGGEVTSDRWQVTVFGLYSSHRGGYTLALRHKQLPTISAPWVPLPRVTWLQCRMAHWPHLVSKCRPINDTNCHIFFAFVGNTQWQEWLSGSSKWVLHRHRASWSYSVSRKTVPKSVTSKWNCSRLIVLLFPLVHNF